jgi:hypothetical protein
MARSRVVKVACVRVIASSARLGLVSSFSPLARDRVMLDEPLACQPLLRHARRSGTDLVLWFEVDPLRCKRPVIDARIDVELGEARVDVLSPGFAPVVEQVGTVPVTDLRAEPVLADAPGRQHHVRMRLGLTVGTHVPVNIEVGDHPARYEFAVDEIACQPNALGLIQLAWNGELDLAG